MGQVSLPRLEKINSKMTWESTLLFNKERWASIKSFIFLKILIQFIFKNNKFKFKTKWINNKQAAVISQYIFKYYYNNNETTVNKKILLNHYIYQFKNKYVLLVVYLR